MTCFCCNFFIALFLQINGPRRSSRSNKGTNRWRDNVDCTPSPVHPPRRRKRTRRKLTTTNVQHQLEHSTDIFNVNMCACGLISQRVSAIAACHNYHAKQCVKFDVSAPPPSNHQLLDIGVRVGALRWRVSARECGSTCA